ncbi:colanic acid biosynthesis glycosyl transferase WcaI [Dyadobacter jejuensis]|uniref:Colanic acid biosynthesis glycosyl transferase WcaI n=1 Tax=Dyadobacter jejuensis TaxID=1082580 RepID=A0A316AG88_9BACT|nr:WcaI family glycosyltransferase [Dyadobacter jejuensis]PWJ55980.1 colanic acid biosynthesis glycosyl transferase WcaI [Dyadobacter jejuensis]
MRILIYGINYAPELTGIGKYTGEMGAWLGEQGHDVTVVTTMPYYPEWEVHPEYRGRGSFIERRGNVQIHRYPIYVPQEVSSIKRILHEFSFLARTSTFWLKSIFTKKYDLVFCVAPPFHIAILPLIYKFIKGGKLIAHIQDLQVDAAKELGMIKNNFFLNSMFGFERFLLKNSSKVSTISEGMKRKILGKGVSENNILMFPNWVDQNTITPVPITDSLRQAWGLGLQDFVVLYSGNLGEKQGLEVIIEVAELTKDLPHLKFVIVGSGGAKAKLEALVAQSNLQNIIFKPLQPYELLPKMLGIANVHLVLQKKSAADLVMPSKLTTILSAGGCAIVTADAGTSLYDLIQNHQVGLICPPESAPALAATIRQASQQDLTVIQANARNYVLHNLTKEAILSSFEISIQHILHQKN